jgi:hypothetical protein
MPARMVQLETSEKSVFGSTDLLPEMEDIKLVRLLLSRAGGMKSTQHHVFCYDCVV